MRTLKPAYDHLIVSVAEKKTTTSGGIIIPDTVEVDQTELISSVVFASDDREYGAYPEGIQVWFKPNAGIPFKFNGKDLRVLQHKEVLFSEVEEAPEAP